MIDLDTKNPAYEFEREVLGLVKRPPGQIRLAELSVVLGLCGTFEIRWAVKSLCWSYPGLSIRRTKAGDVLRCSKPGWAAVEHAATKYLERLEAGRNADAV